MEKVTKIKVKTLRVRGDYVAARIAYYNWIKDKKINIVLFIDYFEEKEYKKAYV